MVSQRRDHAAKRGAKALREAAREASERTEFATIWTPETAAKAAELPRHLMLDTGEAWGSVMQPWQVAVHAAILGLPGPHAARPLVWVDGPTGCGKDQLIAGVALSILHYAPPGYRVTMLSTDHDRSRDVIDTTRDLCRRTEDIPVGSGIEFLRDEIRHTDRGVVIECVATDGASASGARADLFVLNEIQSWADPHGFRVWTETLARYRKKRHGRLAVLSNLPFHGVGDWHRDSWETARARDSGWAYFPIRLSDCPWITPEYIAEQRRNLPKIVFRRLYQCEPTDGRGELIDAELYDRAVMPDVAPALGPTLPGRRFVGVDVGVTRDHAVAVLLRLDPSGAVAIERIDVWVPPAGGEIRIADVQARVLEYGKAWRARAMLDPYQAVQMQQNLVAAGVECERVEATPANLHAQTTAVIELFRDGRMRVWSDAGRTEVADGLVTSLRQQLLDAELRETEKGVRIVSKRTKAGHGDQASAFALAALGVSRATAHSVPECVGSPAPAPGAATRRAHPERLTRRAARFIGPRSSGRRLVG